MVSKFGQTRASKFNQGKVPVITEEGYDEKSKKKTMKNKSVRCQSVPKKNAMKNDGTSAAMYTARPDFAVNALLGC